MSTSFTKLAFCALLLGYFSFPQRSYADVILIGSRYQCDTSNANQPSLLEKRGNSFQVVNFSLAQKKQDSAIKSARENLARLQKSGASKSKITKAKEKRDAAVKIKTDIRSCQKGTLTPVSPDPGPACTTPVLTVQAERFCPPTMDTLDGAVILIPDTRNGLRDPVAEEKRNSAGLYGFVCQYSPNGFSNSNLLIDVVYALTTKYRSMDSGESIDDVMCLSRFSEDTTDSSGFGRAIVYSASHQIYVNIYGRVSLEARTALSNQYVDYLKQFALPCSCG